MSGTPSRISAATRPPQTPAPIQPDPRPTLKLVNPSLPPHIILRLELYSGSGQHDDNDLLYPFMSD